MSPRITFVEASALIRRLEPRCVPPSYWQLRDLDLALGAIDPACVVVNNRVRNRLLDPLDVMLLRLWTRIANSSFQPGWVAGAVISQHRVTIRRVLRRQEARVLVLRGLRSVVVERSEVAKHRGETYPLLDLSLGVVDGMREIRRTRPRVWNGSRNARPSEVDTMPSSQAVEICEVTA